MNTLTLFQERFSIGEIFPDFSTLKKSINLPFVIGSHWYAFSKFMPEFLLEMSHKTSCMFTKTKLISICNEELGDGDIKSNHAELFYKALKENEISLNREAYPDSLNFLREQITSEKSKFFLLGLHLGLEIIANENIEALADGLGKKRELQESLFFKIHMVNEDIHIQKCLDNFKLAKSSVEKELFLQGFDTGLKFWSLFWQGLN